MIQMSSGRVFAASSRASTECFLDSFLARVSELDAPGRPRKDFQREKTKT